MATEEKKRKHKDSSEKKKSKKKHKSSTTIVETTPAAPSGSPVIQQVSSSFSEIVVKLYLHLAPMWAGKTMEGVIEQLNAFLMKYVPEVDGIVLAHSDIKFVTDKGKIMYESPFSHFFITAKFLIWKPKRGSKLVGRINLQSEDHIGLLIYGTFNASIPKSRIPSSTYAWKINEEETATEEKEVEDEDNEESTEAVSEGRQRTQYGEWINKATGAGIGGEDGILEFTVMDIIEANDILTVTGSL
ncbi:uncharacterized protein BX663DRAFT_432106 [Cokeromyces recurvatus]|uniref:uncharacterized protein n=1 Tax=Cokeromyces recurvatus TaxID=90255 RepID=UPI002220A02E|nr:uncharacterized protein BX663DRAFT_432106 [Cokeromyces recurvatus]KAI7904285.1 hypothetical protein BX663DRAFT_432106 [Cokeromyces recurvatus]